MGGRTSRSPLRWRQGALALACAAAIGATPAEGAAGQKVTAATAVDRSCHAKYAGGAAGTQTVTTTAPGTGLVRARLSGAGDWDLGVFDASSGRTIAGSAGFASNELAEGFVKKGQKLRVQACRFRGSASSADLSIDFVAIAERSTGKVQVVDVNTATRKSKRRLQSLGLDLTEHGDSNSVEVVLHGAADERKLRDGRVHLRRAHQPISRRARRRIGRPTRSSRRRTPRPSCRAAATSTAISPTTTSSSSSSPCATRGSSRS